MDVQYPPARLRHGRATNLDAEVESLELRKGKASCPTVLVRGDAAAAAANATALAKCSVGAVSTRVSPAADACTIPTDAIRSTPFGPRQRLRCGGKYQPLDKDSDRRLQAQRVRVCGVRSGHSETNKALAGELQSAAQRRPTVWVSQQEAGSARQELGLLSPAREGI